MFSADQLRFLYNGHNVDYCMLYAAGYFFAPKILFIGSKSEKLPEE